MNYYHNYHKSETPHQAVVRLFKSKENTNFLIGKISNNFHDDDVSKVETLVSKLIKNWGYLKQFEDFDPAAAHRTIAYEVDVLNIKFIEESINFLSYECKDDNKGPREGYALDTFNMTHEKTYKNPYLEFNDFYRQGRIRWQDRELSRRHYDREAFEDGLPVNKEYGNFIRKHDMRSLKKSTSHC